jgi:hypothetical protein
MAMAMGFSSGAPMEKHGKRRRGMASHGLITDSKGC